LTVPTPDRPTWNEPELDTNAANETTAHTMARTSINLIVPE
jgi:hypothetical protein